MGILSSEADRAIGLVYLDPALQNAPATHALVIGVGEYSTGNPPSVTSPSLSARAIAAWILDGTLGRDRAGFSNPLTPLGSLAVLLSEQPGGALSEVEGATVPRATFTNVQRAVETWTTRAGSHRGNLLLLFVASHGESFGRRTAVLLEDYGSNERRPTAGMTEIEQFVDALAEIESENQLLIFDCCRSPTSLRLRYDQQFGITLVEPPARAGLPRRPYVLRSTTLGAEAFGRKNKPTLFTQALLDALKGLAASPTDRWAIDNYKLADIAARLLGLHLRDGTPLQEPDSQISRRFLVSVTPPTETATVFVSLAPNLDFVGSRIRVMDGEALVTEVVGSEDDPPFARLQLLKYQPRTIQALDSSGALIGQTQIEPLPPVAFAELPERFHIVWGGAPKGLGRDVKGRISLSVSASLPNVTSVVATLQRSAEACSPMRVAVSADASQTGFEVDPGWYAIDFAAGDGRLLSTEFEVKPGGQVTAHLDLLGLTQGGRPAPVSAAATEIASAERSREISSTDEPDRRAWLATLGASESKIVAHGEGDDRILLANVAPPQLLRASPDEGAAPRVAELAFTSEPGTGIGFAIHDQEVRRLGAGPNERPPSLSDWPAWVAVTGSGWRELAFVPSIGGFAGRFQYDSAGRPAPWLPKLKVEPSHCAASSHIELQVPTRQWSGLLSFLGSRDFERSAVILEHLLSQMTIRTALLQKIDNPLAATAAALVAVGTERLATARIPEEWFSNLAAWFPGLPDGPVIKARRLLSRHDFASHRTEAKALLLDACRRGVPVFSLSVDWLAQGLALFARDTDAEALAHSARSLSQLVDPMRAFTVVRISPEVQEDHA
ncbi:caspase family protein [Bradyrhizobium sp. PMVTL-01]|uniref:caspase family protein n=1 Tax=Bradyrhizobium sp. PMVTL-01 TaxID=3434999 RepID=UPI003F708A01